MAKKIQSSVVVITGASSGIGRATALACAKAGATVVVSARREQALNEVARECELSGGTALAIAADVTDQAALDNLVQQTLGRFGRIDVWFNNAGVTVAGRFEEVPPDVYRQVIETNLFGTINGSRAVLPCFREQGSGTIINHASVLGKFGASQFSAYCASKFGIVGFSESLRQELRDTDIDVCILMPAAIDTPLYNQAANYSGRAVKPVQPVYPAEHVASAVLRLIESPQRQTIVGNAGRAASISRIITPHALSDRFIARQWEADHFKPEPADPGPGNVFEPDPLQTNVSGNWSTSESSAGTYVAAGLAAVTIPAAILWTKRSRRSGDGILSSNGLTGSRKSRFKIWK